MAKLVILYGHPADPAAFEDYYASRHRPTPASTCLTYRGAGNMRVVSAAEGGPAPYYRVSQLTYDSVEDLQAGGSRPKTAGPPSAVARTSHGRRAPQ